MANSVKISDLEYNNHNQLNSSDELVLVSIKNSTKRTIKSNLSDITKYTLTATSIGTSIKAISTDISSAMDMMYNNELSVTNIISNLNDMNDKINELSKNGEGSSSEIKKELQEISNSLSSKINDNKQEIDKISNGISSVGVMEEICNNISAYSAINLSANAISSYFIKGNEFKQIDESEPPLIMLVTILKKILL